ncbi:hypothetical protein [Rhizobium mongolense]|uniref:Prolyl oligopeptidase PreP (S9A serine peptidase family) n=1 Tax=Rhizobium mongolense TaxID=57676 RepID=A0A7W6RQ65_9HYPH|nr:hypothetical protein [Rhizobium mongolense]MBB4276643.1 prolyl oligopeptidase PreP (S9A serine peptidase family) [Rhizobium mongolense]
MTEIDPRPTLNTPDDDPCLWLEDIDGEKVFVWVADPISENSGTLW